MNTKNAVSMSQHSGAETKAYHTSSLQQV